MFSAFCLVVGQVVVGVIIGTAVINAAAWGAGTVTERISKIRRGWAAKKAAK